MRVDLGTTLIINRDKDKFASGYIMLDDGISKDSEEKNKY